MKPIQIQKLIAAYEKRIVNLERTEKLQTALIGQMEDKNRQLEEYCRVCEEHIHFLMKAPPDETKESGIRSEFRNEKA